MYGLWWIVIGSAILMIIGIILWILNNDCVWEFLFGLGVCLTVIFALVIIVLVLFAIFIPITAQQQYQEYIIQKEYVQEAYENGTEYDNIAITQTIIEMNTWLAQAKASKQTYGNWSMYYNVDIENLAPISLSRQEDDDSED